MFKQHNVQRFIATLVVCSILLTALFGADTRTARANVVSVIIEAESVSAAIDAVRMCDGYVTAEIDIINAVAAEISSECLTKLAGAPGVVRVTPDREVNTSSTQEWGQVDVEFSKAIGVSGVWERGNYGDNVTVAILDTGIDTTYPALRRSTLSRDERVLAYYDAVEDKSWVSPYLLRSSRDPNGHGTHVAGIIGNSEYERHDEEFRGIAPAVDLVAVRVLNEEGAGTYADVLQGINWVVEHKDEYNIRVMNISMYAVPLAPYWADPYNLAVMAAWRAGIVVVASAGNTGPDPMSIGVPGNTPYVITVGAYTDHRTPEDYGDDYIPEFSAAGPTLDAFVKPDVIAPGAHIQSLMRPNTYLREQYNEYRVDGRYFEMSGTSMSTAMVSGIAALVISENPDLTPDEVKYRILQTARPQFSEESNQAAYSIWQQGAGRVWAEDAVYADITGTANKGLDINADLAGEMHYQGWTTWDAESGAFTLPVADENGWISNYTTWDGSYVNFVDGYTTWSMGDTNWGDEFLNWTDGFGSWADGFGSWADGFGSWADGFGSWADGFGSWADTCGVTGEEGFGSWADGFGSWADGFGSWADGFGSWADSTLLAGDLSTWTGDFVAWSDGFGSWADAFEAWAEENAADTEYCQNWVEGFGSWADGFGSWADGFGSWADGFGSWADGFGSWADGFGSWADGFGSWADACITDIDGFGSWADGFGSWADGFGSWADSTLLTGEFSSWANDFSSWADAFIAWAEENTVDTEYCQNWLDGFGSWADGFGSWADGFGSWADGFGSWADYVMDVTGASEVWAGGYLSWADGFGSWADGFGSWADACGVSQLDGFGSWADEFLMWLDGFGSWADGFGSWADSFSSWADYVAWIEGFGSWADGFGSWADGFGSWADANLDPDAPAYCESWADGFGSWADGFGSWADGFGSWADGFGSWADGVSSVVGDSTEWNAGYTSWADALQDLASDMSESTQTVVAPDWVDGYRNLENVPGENDGASINAWIP